MRIGIFGLGSRRYLAHTRNILADAAKVAAERRDIPSGTKFRGQAIGDSMAAFASAFPDVHRELLSIYVAENVVVVELATRGTHKGGLALASGTPAPTGRAIDVPSDDVFHLESGKIKSFHCYNAASVMQQQLGVDVG